MMSADNAITDSRGLKRQRILTNEAEKVAAATMDRISDLPDSVLCHILSFLPTKQSVATCILSKRWIRLWSMVPVLDLDSNLHSHPTGGTCKSFVDFVNSVLILRGADPIKRFSLKYGFPKSYFCDQSMVNVWVTAVTKHKLEKLDLYIPNFSLLPCVFSLRTLVDLKMNVVDLGDIFPVHFPSLKTLHLTVNNSMDHSRVTKLLSGCPFLEELEVQTRSVTNKSTFECFRFHVLFFNLVKASLRFTSMEVTCKQWMLSFVRELYNVNVLRFSGSIVSLLSNAAVNELPIFHKLTHLHLGVNVSYPSVLFSSLLQNSPHLEVLTIDQEGNHTNLKNELRWTLPRQPAFQCVSLHLREVNFIRYYGSLSELEFAQFILKNAKVLESMKIWSPTVLEAERRLRNLSNLSACTRCSERCRLLFYRTA